MYVEGEGTCSVAQYSGRCSPVQGAVCGKSCRAFVEQADRPATRPATPLWALAQQSAVAKGAQESVEGRSEGAPQFLLRSDDVCVDLVRDSHRSTPVFQSNVTGAAEQPRGSVKPVDQFHKVQIPPAEDGKELLRAPIRKHELG